MEEEVVLDCGHKMCRNCIEKLHSMICPYCRRNMITNKNVNKVITNIIQKVLEQEQDKIKCNQIIQSIDELYEHRAEISVSELTKNILITMMNISNINIVKQIIKEETCISVIDKNY
jgi:GTPase SAR1 family protein